MKSGWSGDQVLLAATNPLRQKIEVKKAGNGRYFEGRPSISIVRNEASGLLSSDGSHHQKSDLNKSLVCDWRLNRAHVAMLVEI